MFLLNILISNTFNIYDFDLKIKNFPYRNYFNNMYFMYDITEDEKFYNLIYEDTENILPRLEKLYNFITNHPNYFTYNVYEDTLFIPDNSQVDMVIPLDSIQINENFIKFFQLKLDSGELFSVLDYSDTNPITPVILGYSYINDFKIGDIFLDYQSKQYKVIGFLNENSYYFNLKSNSNIIYLNNTVLIPIQSNKWDDFTDYDTIINNSYIYSSNVENLFEIQQKSNDLNLFTYSIKTFEDQLDYIKKDTEQGVTLILQMYLIISLFTFTSIIVYFIRFIESNLYEFSIHLVCGSHIKNIMSRIIIQQSILLLLPLILTTLFFKNNLLLNLSYSIVITLILTLMAYVKLKSLPIYKILRCK